jgi:predicted ATPase
MQTRLGKLNVIIGANASGKSNFVNILKFLKDIFTNGLDNAIAMQGGVEGVRNVNIGSSKDLMIELSTSLRPETEPFIYKIKRGRRRIPCTPDFIHLKYEFCVEFFKKKSGYIVKEERLDFNFSMVERTRTTKRERRELRKGKEIAKVRISLSMDKAGKFEFRHEPRSLPLPIAQLFPFMRLKRKIPKIHGQRLRKELSLLGPSLGGTMTTRTLTFYSPFTSQLRNFLSSIAIYDIDPKLSKKSTLITGKTELDSDGSNLAGVLKSILSAKKNRRKLSNLMKDLLPFIEDLSVEKQADRSVLTSLKESYSGKKYLPAPLISDGTINLTALIIALYFEDDPLIVVEEPERNIHPRLISKILDMMKDVSEKMGKQIIITTHNPEVVKNAGVENLLLIYRHEGFSAVDRPAERERVREFLKNEIGVDELFTKNLLGE